jgi:hypothetical protein
MQELADKVWANPAFHEAASSIRRAWIARDTGNEVDYLPSLKDVAKVVRASAILACSTNSFHREKAYSAATSAFELYGADELPLDQATRVVLARLGNFPAILTRKAIEEAQPFMPLRLVTEEIAQTGKRTIMLQDKPVVLTDFQHRLWTKLMGKVRLAVAAPTSAGKSFVLQNFLISRLDQSEHATVVYIVPTRALIAQVARDLRGLLSAKLFGESQIEVVTVPIEAEMPLPPRAVYVMTQERLQLMIGGHPAFRANVIVVDEAHAIADGSRGILLHWVIEELLAREPNAQLLFASPGIRNLDVFGRLLGLTDIESFPSREPTVAQNFLTVRIEDPKEGLIALHLLERGFDSSLIARRHLGRRTVTRVEMLVNVACAFGSGATNIVYANGAGDAEDIALKLAARFADRTPTPQRDALAQLVAEAVHASYALVECTRKGIAFHYSNIPTQVRQAVEKAVTDGVIDYLVCTSTLLQGVNLPAKNVFMCRPEKGHYVPLESVDFWNLAGRAGRLLKEFQGNIFLIEYDRWKKQPLNQPREANITAAIEAGILNRRNDLLQVISQPGSISDTDLEAVFVRLLDDHSRGRLNQALARMREGNLVTDEMIASVRDAVVAVADEITVPREVLRKSPNISAHKQQQLYNALARSARVSPEAARALLPKHPRDDGAYASYVAILELCHRIILRLKPESRFHRFLALIALWWMEGRPLPRIVQNQINRNRGRDRRLVVRDTLELVERDVRYQCVRLFSCYTAILIQVLDDLDLKDVRENVPALPLFLEVGASDRTMISLMSLGLTRLVAMKLAPQAPSRELDIDGTRNWLRFRPLDSLGLSASMQEEVTAVLAAFGQQPPLR